MQNITKRLTRWIRSGLLVARFSAATGLVVVFVGLTAHRPIIAETPDRDFFRVGNVIEVRRANDYGSGILTVTARDANSWSGLFAKTMDERLANEVTGHSVLADKWTWSFTTSRLDFSDDQWKPSSWSGQGDAKFLGPLLLSNNNRMSLRVIATQSGDEVSQRVTRQQQAVAAARANYKRFRPIVDELNRSRHEDELKRAGYELRFSPVGEEGRPSVSWVDGDNHADGKSRAYKLAELAPLEHLAAVYLGRLAREEDLAHVANLKSVDQLFFNKLKGEQLGTLSGMQRIGHLRVVEPNAHIYSQLGRLSGLEGITIAGNQSGVALLADLPRLRSLEVDCFGSRIPNLFPAFRGHKTLERLEVRRGPPFDDATLSELSSLPALLKLAWSFQGDVRALKNLQSRSLEEVVLSTPPIDYAFLAQWDLPRLLPKLRRVRVPLWMPSDLVADLTELKQLSPDVLALYEATNSLRGMYLRFRAADFARERENVAILGGVLAGDENNIPTQRMIRIRREFVAILQELDGSEATMRRALNRLSTHCEMNLKQLEAERAIRGDVAAAIKVEIRIARDAAKSFGSWSIPFEDGQERFLLMGSI